MNPHRVLSVLALTCLLLAVHTVPSSASPVLVEHISPRSRVLNPEFTVRDDVGQEIGDAINDAVDGVDNAINKVEDETGLSRGAIIAIAAGAAVVVLLLLICLCCCCCCR
ncbi:hypothetical protein BWQ96_02985 [Gracilariopsis chorda]|uniref:t-SNARE coiled-coil homology domain-containing protein n=1 Tax=Gracilariopsis chorda TaxID=448386 RepID=A0A2V3J1E5_9FLOR|nr:hypothetical protein BWQ96_02985 [Gracilariopsis chorda]|eukprot:PXF47210.1 hypothetical protein BWQ96_02985 [Gracilariopsis chorda]